MPTLHPPRAFARSVSMLVALALATGCGSGSNVEPRPELIDPWPSANADLEADVVALVNARRAEGATCGDEVFGPADPLVLDPFLEEAARHHSYDMAIRDFFGHTNLDGMGPGERLAEIGYASWSWGENIATGSTAEGVMASWMGSEGHCRNIMSPNFDEIGVGTYDGLWTQVFAEPQ